MANEDKTPLEKKLYSAIRYVLNRVQSDPEFRWHMDHTEAHAQLIAAEAEFVGMTVEAVMDARRKGEYHGRRSDCAANRDRVRTLEALLDEHRIAYPERE
jgi:hypothetical protein